MVMPISLVVIKEKNLSISSLKSYCYSSAHLPLTTIKEKLNDTIEVLEG
jgi:hypothetical protein